MKLEFQIFDTLQEPCLITNRSLRIHYCNDMAAQLLGVSARKIIRNAMSLWELIEFSEDIPGLNHLEDVTSPTPMKEVKFKSLADQKEGKIQVTVQPLCSEWPEGQDPLWILFVRDVTLEERLQNRYQAELKQKEHIIKDLEKTKLILEDYSKNLEDKVAERTHELVELNQTMQAMLDSLHQGFFIFNKRGNCLPVVSKACRETLEANPAGQHLADVLRLTGAERESLMEWLDTLFSAIMPFEDAASFGPTHFKHSMGRMIELSYYPVSDANKELEGVVAVATDTTSLVEARAELEAERSNAKLVINIIKNRRQIQNFIDDCQRIIRQLQNEMHRPMIDRRPGDLFRSLHTLKGGASTLGLADLAERCHEAEAIIKELRDDAQNEILQESSLLDRWQQVGAFVKVIEAEFNRFLEWTEQLIGKNLSKERVLEITFSQFVSVLGKISHHLNQEQIKQILIDEFLTVPLHEQFKAFQETLNQVSRVLQKPLLPLVVESEPIKVIPEYYQEMLNSMVHVFRNAVDHGIESIEERRQLGKPDAGQIRVNIGMRGETLVIQVADDGAGIDPLVVRKKLAERGIDAGSESDEDVIQHIFKSGFSTRNQVTSISGQGVGMEAVMKSVRDLGGRAYVRSQLNAGTTVVIEVPYVKRLGRLRILSA